MMTRRRTLVPLTFSLGLLALLVVALVVFVQAQPAGKYAVPLVGGPTQYTLKVDTSTANNRTEIGCEADQLGTANAVNGFRITGAATGSNPTILGFGCANGGDTNVGGALTVSGTGTWAIGGTITTGVAFLPARKHCTTDIAFSTAANLQPVRVAANDWGLRRTASGAETYNIQCQLDLAGLQRSTASKGIRIDSFSIVQQIGTAALTSNTFNALSQIVYANNTATAVTGFGGTITITMPTATQANPYVTAATVGTPAWSTTAAATYALDFTVVMANTGVYTLYGIVLTYSTALY